MAVGLNQPGTLFPVKGVRLASVAAGIRYKDRDDLVLIEMSEGSECVGVFTKNAFCAAPVTVARKHLETAPARYLLINSGNANAGTGVAGMAAAEASCRAVAASAGVVAEAVLPFSTGVIGQPLPVERIEAQTGKLVAALNDDAWLDTAKAIMTTDTLPKAVSRQLVIDGLTVTITGIAKGSGMICPNMATMLGYVATDAKLSRSLAQRLLTETTDLSFNSITVDSDTSTNDACIFMATGQSGVVVAEGAALIQFYDALLDVMQGLAHSIVRDGEGATKFVTLHVTGAASVEEARAVGYTVGHSPLVKTALFASDANWGRILAAVGRAPVDALDVNLVNISVGGVSIVENGEPAASYTEKAGSAEFAREEITILIDLQRGAHQSKIWTTDLSHEYVTINADYRS